MRDTMHNPKRKVYHEHIILLIEGRLLMLFFVAGLIWLWTLFIRDGADSLRENIFSILFLLAITGLAAIAFYGFWYRCFGRLIIDEDEIIWKCPFMKTRRLHKDEIRYTGFDYRFKGGSLRDITTMDMAYFSKKPYPQDAVNKSYKLRNSDDFIKFHASKKLCLHLSEWLPEPRNRIFDAAYDNFVRKERRRRKRR